MIEFTPYLSSSQGNLYWVSDGQTPLLLECGAKSPTHLKRLIGFRTKEVAGCLLSHAHGDHSECAGSLMEHDAVDLYCSAGTAEALGLSGNRLHMVEPLKQFSIEAWKIVPFETAHDCPGSLGFLLGHGDERLLFATDTFYVGPQFRGLTVIAIECNYSPETLDPDISPAKKQRLYSSHFSLENVLKFLQANDLSRVREIHLLHLSRENSNAEMFRERVQKATGKPVYVAPEMNA